MSSTRSGDMTDVVADILTLLNPRDGGRDLRAQLQQEDITELSRQLSSLKALRSKGEHLRKSKEAIEHQESSARELRQGRSAILKRMEDAMLALSPSSKSAAAAAMEAQPRVKSKALDNRRKKMYGKQVVIRLAGGSARNQRAIFSIVVADSSGFNCH